MSSKQSVKFYYIPESPPCRVVEMVANMAGVELDRQYVNLFTGEHLKEDYIKINPSHKVPFIIDGDLKLGESRAIIAYLVDKYMPADDSLYPKDLNVRSKINEILYFAAATLFPAGGKLFRPMIFGNADKLDEQAEKEYKETLTQLESRLKQNQEGSKFIVGDNLTIADIDLSSLLSFPEVFDYSLDEFPILVDYLERLKRIIPKYHEINDETIERFRNFVKSKAK